MTSFCEEGRKCHAPRLKELYNESVVPAMMEKFGYENSMEVPKLNKVVINMGVGDAKENPRFLEAAMEDFPAITGPKTHKSPQQKNQ